MMRVYIGIPYFVIENQDATEQQALEGNQTSFRYEINPFNNL